MAMSEVDLQRRPLVGPPPSRRHATFLQREDAPPTAARPHGRRHAAALRPGPSANGGQRRGRPDRGSAGPARHAQGRASGTSRPNPYAINQKGGGAVTELPANPYAVENDPVSLTNPRFVGEPRLEKIAKGGPPLSTIDNGRTVKAVQQALIDLGFELVQHEKDGDYGPETQTAIKLFRIAPVHSGQRPHRPRPRRAGPNGPQAGSQGGALLRLRAPVRRRLPGRHPGGRVRRERRPQGDAHRGARLDEGPRLPGDATGRRQAGAVPAPARRHLPDQGRQPHDPRDHRPDQPRSRPARAPRTSTPRASRTRRSRSTTAMPGAGSGRTSTRTSHRRRTS